MNVKLIVLFILFIGAHAAAETKQSCDEIVAETTSMNRDFWPRNAAQTMADANRDQIEDTMERVIATLNAAEWRGVGQHKSLAPDYDSNDFFHSNGDLNTNLASMEELKATQGKIVVALELKKDTLLYIRGRVTEVIADTKSLIISSLETNPAQSFTVSYTLNQNRTLLLAEFIGSDGTPNISDFIIQEKLKGFEFAYRDSELLAEKTLQAYLRASSLNWKELARGVNGVLPISLEPQFFEGYRVAGYGKFGAAQNIQGFSGLILEGRVDPAAASGEQRSTLKILSDEGNEQIVPVNKLMRVFVHRTVN